MSKQAIDAVLAAETKAKENKSHAAVKARQLISAAGEDGKSRLETAREAAARDMNDKLALITEQSEALLAKSRTDAEAEAAEGWRAARRNLDDAVAIIIGEIRKNADS